MADPIKERLERRGQQDDLAREQVEIEMLGDQSHLAANDRNRAVARSDGAAKTRGDLTRVAESTRRDTRKPEEGKKPEKPADKLTTFKIDNSRGLNDLMLGRPKQVARPPEATLRRTDAGTQQARQARPTTEISRPSGATRLAEGRAVQGRREAATAERPQNDQLPREQAHLRAGTPRPLSFLQRLRIAAQIRAYVANLFKPVGPSTPEGANARQLQASLGQKKLQGSDPKNQLTSGGTAGQPAGATTTGTKGAAKEASTPETAGHLFAFDGTTGDAETQACVADNRDAFCRLGAGESPLVFDAAAWNEVQRERSEPPHLRNTSTETTHAHRRVAARRGRGDRMTG